MFKRILVTLLAMQITLSGAALAVVDLPENSFVTFSEASKIALKNSPTILSRKYVVQSADAKAFAEQVKYLPNLGFNANTKYISKIGQIQTPLGNQTVGTHLNWAIGPNLNWVLWDTGQIWNRSKSLKKTADAETQNLDYDTRQVILDARTAYVNVQLTKAQLYLVSDALRLARAQYNYVFNRKEAGTADLFDLTVAHQEMVDREKDLEQARGNLAIAKRIFIAALGLNPEMESCDAVEVERIEAVLKELLPLAGTSVNVEAHPQVLSLAAQQRSNELAAKSTFAKYFPEVKAQGSAEYDYPNFGIDDTVQQNIVGVGLSVPILDWGTISKTAKSYRYQAYSANEQKKQTVINLSSQVSQTREQIVTMKELRVANARVVRDAVEVARLSFESYQAGKIIFLDVQRANNRALAAKIDAATNDANLAVQISNLLALAETEGGP